MNIGTKVVVKAYPNKELERLVLKEAEKLYSCVPGRGIQRCIDKRR